MRFDESLASGGLRFALVRGLQQAQPVTDYILRVLVAFPLIFDLQACPKIGVHGLQLRPPEGAIGHRVWREQGTIRAAEAGLGMSGLGMLCLGGSRLHGLRSRSLGAT